jgi:hypothetical protein
MSLNERRWPDTAGKYSPASWCGGGEVISEIASLLIGVSGVCGSRAAAAVEEDDVPGRLLPFDRVPTLWDFGRIAGARAR